MTFAEVRKAVVGVCTAITVIGNIILNTVGVIPDAWARPITAVVVVAGAVLTYFVPNDEKPPAKKRVRRAPAKHAAPPPEA